MVTETPRFHNEEPIFPVRPVAWGRTAAYLSIVLACGVVIGVAIFVAVIEGSVVAGCLS